MGSVRDAASPRPKNTHRRRPLAELPRMNRKMNGRWPRHPHHDYAAPATWLITVCTWNKSPLFGPFRDVAAECWEAIPQHFDHVRLDAYAVVPTHLHGIVELTKRGAPLSTIVRSFKAAATYRIHITHPGLLVWHVGYHDERVGSGGIARVRRYVAANSARHEDAAMPRP